MIARIHNPDTPADLELKQVLDRMGCFVMVAGAGSGKTTSLVKAMAHVAKEKRAEYLKSGRQIACITYTEVAEQELARDLGNDPLCHISTIHSFMWQLIRPFQADIRRWVARRNQEKLDELCQKQAGFGPRIQAKTREATRREIEECEQLKSVIPGVPKFTYETGRDYRSGILGHDDILKMVPALIRERPLLRRLIAQRYPYFFFDESQDTDDGVVDALKEVSRHACEQGVDFCLGFFGDPMQKIYTAGKGSIDLLNGWTKIEKPENFRCPARVLATINRIRRDGDGLQQTAGVRMRDGTELPQEQGSSCIIILSSSEDRETSASRVRAYLAAKNVDLFWSNDDPTADLRVLVIEHAMAARRLGFDKLYDIFNHGSESAKASFREGKNWLLTPFQSLLLPLADAVRNARHYEVMSLLRRFSPALEPKTFRQTPNAVELLSKLKVAVEHLEKLLALNGTATIAGVLRFAHESRMVRLDGRIARVLVLPDDSKEVPQNEPVGNAAETTDSAQPAEPIEEVLLKYLDCPASQLWGYREYIEDRSVYSTQQGIKGAEFQRVLVILDDEESNHFLFSYDKLLGITPPSDTDRKNQAEGKETVVDRTRRLFYVCCSRALKGLAVVCYTSHPDVLKGRVLESGLFPIDCIFGAADLQP